MTRWIRTKALPWVVWVATMAAVAALWVDLRGGSALGFVPDVEYTVAPRQGGRVESLSAEVGQRVAAGQVVATLDAREIDAELQILTAERSRVEAEIRAARAATEADQSDTRRDLDESVEAAERALQAARSDRNSRSAELGALKAQVEAVRELVEKRMADRRELDELVTRHSGLESEVAASDAVIGQLVRQASAAKARRGELPPDAAMLATEPLRAELEVLDRRAELLAVRKQDLVLRSPFAGRVAAIRARPGDVLSAGAAVATIVGDRDASDPQARRVLVCLDETQAGRVQFGEAALLYPRGAAGASVSGHVTALGPRVSELPLRCRRDPQVPEWGREVTVTLDEPAPLLSGQAFGVAFQGVLSPHAETPVAETPAAEAPVVEAPVVEPAPAPQAAPAPRREPAAMEVPPALAARTRLEPSAATWSARLDRFVIVSDDTGLQGRDDHAPWLFTMDARGRVDAEPLVIAGLAEVSDLEAIAHGPQDSLYVLASQSRSKRGKRPAARQVFARVGLAGAGAQAERAVHLADLLDRAGAEVRAGLGLADTAALDIEGMTGTAAGGLLLGLKAPLSAAGEALVWHLARPDRLLAGEGLAAAGLSRWGSLRLSVTADGSEVPGGISELLELADGSLLVAATASGLDPAAQSGSLWLVAGRSGLAAPRRLREFPGLKPEGLALAGDGRAVVVVFDTGDAAPLWTELPWPAP